MHKMCSLLIWIAELIYCGYQKLFEGSELESLTLKQLGGTNYLDMYILGKMGRLMREINKER